MNSNRFVTLRGRLPLPSAAVAIGCLLAWMTLGARPVLAAADGAFQAQLVWGTNGEKPRDKPLKELDPKLQERLKGVFKWKNYYEVNRKALPVPKAGAQKVKLSDKCELQVQDLGSSRIEIRLFGEGVLVVKKVQSVIPGEAIVLGGFDKNDTAWFVVVTPPK